MDQDRCSCGAVLARGALSCSLCHAPAVAEVPAGGGSAQPQEAGPNGFLPAQPRGTLRLDERTFSRTQQGPLSFGLLGRTVITVLMLLPVAFIWFMSGGGLVTLILTIPTAALPLWYMSETWRRHRVR